MTFTNLVALQGLAFIAVFIVIPLFVTLVVALAILAPRWSQAGRWRPGETWSAEPLWIGPTRTESSTTHTTGGARGQW